MRKFISKHVYFFWSGWAGVNRDLDHDHDHIHGLGLVVDDVELEMHELDLGERRV